MLAAGAAALAITAPVAAQKGGHGGGKEHGQGHGKSAMAHGQSAMAHGNSSQARAVHGRSNVGVIRTSNGRLYALDRRGSCPPGLAKKGNGCMPPGLAKNIVGTRLPATLMGSMLAGPYRSWYRDNDDYYYRWDDDYIYRVDRGDGLISALFPYTNRDYYYYPVGMQYPGYYNYYNVPYQYQSFYPDGGDYWYRYGDGAIYQVNPSSGVISGIAALLTGDPFAVGQPLPIGYSTYNVPFAYRDRYYDTPDAWYRYNDGYIYRVDPTTQLITAVINALV
jgi:hypothetical protein